MNDKVDHQHDAAATRRAARRLIAAARKAASLADASTALDKASSALRVAIDLEQAELTRTKTVAETCKLESEAAANLVKERGERRRDYLSIISPLVAIITLGVTLLFQGVQLKDAAAERARAAESSQWQEALKAAVSHDADAAAAAGLRPYLESAAYHHRAVVAVTDILVSRPDDRLFATLFTPTFTPSSWANLSDLLDLDMEMTTISVPVYAKAWDPSTKSYHTPKPPDDKYYDYLNIVFSRITGQIGVALRTPRGTASAPNLADKYFKDGDWHGADLGGAILEASRFQYMDFDQADLSAIQNFANLSISTSAWWHAKRISPELREYLVKTAPYKPTEKYGPFDTELSQADFDDNLRRLRTFDGPARADQH